MNHGFKPLNVFLNSFVCECWLNNIRVTYQVLSKEMLSDYQYDILAQKSSDKTDKESSLEFLLTLPIGYLCSCKLIHWKGLHSLDLPLNFQFPIRPLSR
jgi:hypothetical protein